MLLPHFPGAHIPGKGVQPQARAPCSCPCILPDTARVKEANLQAPIFGKLVMTLQILCGNLYQQAQRKEKVEGPNTKDPPAQPGDELTGTLWTLASVIQAKLNP